MNKLDHNIYSYSGPPFAPIREACTITGLSQCFLRKGCKAGTIPHILSGTKYLIDIPALLFQLRAGYGSEGGKTDA